MFKRYFFTPVCLITLGILLSACNISIHALNAPSALPVANTATASVASPVATTSAVADISSVVVPAAWPAPVADAGMRIIYKLLGQQQGRNATKTLTGRFPATPGYVIHVSCRGSGMITVAVSSGIFNELSCPQDDNVNEYYTSSSTAHYTIRVTVQGAIAWRVVVEAAL
jgi:hypothetical protein